MSKASARRKLAKLRAEFYAAPWAIDVRSLGGIASAIERRDLAGVRAQMEMGSDSAPDTALVSGIAVIPVCGVLQDENDWAVKWGYAASYQLIERDLAAALSSDDVKGILFYMDTPGGSAIGCKRVADLIFKARGKKPLRAFVQGVCCSAGYYIASACDRIEATADSLIASVGTIFAHQEYSGLLKEMGISATVFTNKESPAKGHGNPYEPLSDDARKTLQKFVDSYGAPFISDVAQFRGLPRDVVSETFGQGDAMRADIAIGRRMIDGVVGSFNESLQSMAGSAGGASASNSTPASSVGDISRSESLMDKKIKAQLFALGLVKAVDASDEDCKTALAAFFAGRSQAVPSDEAKILAGLQSKVAATSKADDDEEDEEEEVTDKGGKAGKSEAGNRNAEQREARLADLRASAELLNASAGTTVITGDKVLAAMDSKEAVKEVAAKWAKEIADGMGGLPTDRVNVKGEGADRFAADVIDAQVYRAGHTHLKLSDDASKLVNMPLWAVAHKCLQLGGRQVDDYATDKEMLAEQAMSMAQPFQHQAFFSPKENRRYISASGTPAARPGDFPNILSGLANKFLDTIELDEDYSYSMVSALLPGGLNDFKPGLLINRGVTEELDEVQDAEQIKELSLGEEVLSYIFLRRFANKWGWTPVMVANDDLNAFAEGMLGLDAAWQVTQNRLVLDRFTANENLLDGSALFANRTDTGAGTNPALNNNDRTSGAAPSDDEWAAMETLYADIGGINTGRRVRGTINTWFGPTGTAYQAARRTFMPLGAAGLEQKVATATSSVGIYRGEVTLVPESELRASSLTKYYGLRSPTKLNTATVIRGYFNGFGEMGRRERWYDPNDKTTWVSIEGRIAVAVKNWRYAIRNAGA